MTFFTKSLLATTIILTGGLAVFNQSAAAHHSFSATFQKDAKITVEGVVKAFSFSNPHVLVTFDKTNEDGSTTEWVVEAAAATLLRRSGWSADRIKPGDYIRVSGDSTHDGTPMVGLDSLQVLNIETQEIVMALTPRNGKASALEINPAPPEEDAQWGNGYPPYDTPKIFEDGRPNLSLFWANTPPRLGRQRPEQPVFNAAGQKKQASFVLANDPQVFCDSPGLVRQGGLTPHSYQIIQNETSVEIKYEEYGVHRIIPVGEIGDTPIDSGVKTHLGDSIAYYDGDVLVIETINLLENYSAPVGLPISDQASVIERYKRADDGTSGSVVDFEMIVTDPLYLEKPVRLAKVKSAVKGYEMVPNDCQAPLRERTEASSATSFFLASRGLGDGTNLGGLAGADAHCEALASSVGVGDRGWRAYLSTTGDNAVNAVERIGAGPWHNSRGELIAANVEALRASEGAATAGILTEMSTLIPARENRLNQHDILEEIGDAGLFYCFASVPTTSENRLAKLQPASAQTNLQGAANVSADPRGLDSGMGAANVQNRIQDQDQGGKAWLWAVLGALVLAGLGFVARRSKN